MWRAIESFVAAVSLALCVGLGFWTVHSDQRLDQFQCADVRIWGNSGKVLVAIGGPSIGPAVPTEYSYKQFSYGHMQYDPSGKTPGCPELDWTTFTYTGPGEDGNGVRSAVLPVWLLLLGLTILPGLWILRIGRPRRARRRPSPAKSATGLTFAG
jgi:hypothetical protein